MSGFHLELGSGGHSFAGKAIVVNSKTGEHMSNMPVSLEEAKEKMRKMEGDKPKMAHSKHLVEMIDVIKALPKDATGELHDPSAGADLVEQYLNKKRYYKFLDELKKIRAEMPDLLYKKKTESNLKKAYKPLIDFLERLPSYEEED